MEEKRRGGEDLLVFLGPTPKTASLARLQKHIQWTFHFCMHNWYLLERLDTFTEKQANEFNLCKVHSVLSYIVQVPV